MGRRQQQAASKRQQQNVEELFSLLTTLVHGYSEEEAVVALLMQAAVFACWRSQTMTEAVDTFRAWGASAESFVRNAYPRVADQKLAAQKSAHQTADEVKLERRG
jgi:hypothetical protein